MSLLTIVPPMSGAERRFKPFVDFVRTGGGDDLAAGLGASPQTLSGPRADSDRALRHSVGAQLLWVKGPALAGLPAASLEKT